MANEARSKMLVFISWSGPSSRAVAQALREWLPQVLQAVDLWMSAEDIEKGARWNSDIADQLSKAQAGIICVTKENTEAPWLLFESGALSKTVDRSFVCPYLFNLKAPDLTGPLVQFQATIVERDDTKKLVQTLNRALGTDGISEKQLDKTFDVWWPDLQKRLDEIPVAKSKSSARRADKDLLEEILALVRRIASERSRPVLLQGAFEQPWSLSGEAQARYGYVAPDVLVRRPNLGAYLVPAGQIRFEPPEDTAPENPPEESDEQPESPQKRLRKVREGDG